MKKSLVVAVLLAVSLLSLPARSESLGKGNETAPAAATTPPSDTAGNLPIFLVPKPALCTATAQCNDGSTISCSSYISASNCVTGFHSVLCDSGPVKYCPECNHGSPIFLCYI
jgi:hypothetical protein